MSLKALLPLAILLASSPVLAASGDGNNGCGVGNGGSNGTKSCSESSGSSPVSPIINVSPTPITVTPSPVPVIVNQAPVRVLTPVTGSPITVNTPAQGPTTATGGLGGAGGYATSTSNGGAGGTANGGQASATAGSSNVVINQQTRRAASAPSLGALPNGPCTGAAGGVSIGLPGMAGGIQGSGEDKDCTLRYNITIVEDFDPELAIEMLNGLSGVKEAKARLGRTGDTKADFIASCQANWTMACQQAIYGDR
jgi:hypothetical protein